MNDFPLKTWRALALIFLLTTVVLLFSARAIFFGSYPLSDSEKKFPLINPFRFQIDQKDIVVNFQPLRDYLRDEVKGKGRDQVSLYFEFFNTGANISINQDLKILPASLAKLPLAMVVMKRVEKGETKLGDVLKIQEGQQDRGSGELYKQPVGTQFSVKDLLGELLHHSDNTAYHMLADQVGKEEFTEIIDETGLDELFDDNGKVSAKEYARVLRSLYNASFLNIEDSTALFDILSKTDFDDFLGSAIPGEVTFAHKWGENTIKHVYSDAGIVYVPNRPYMLVVSVQGDQTPDERKKAVEIMNDISKAVYQYVSQYQR